MENIQGQGNGGNNGNKKGIFTNLKSSVTSAYLYLLPAAVWCSLVLINIAKINGASLKDADKAMASTVVIGVAFLIISKMENHSWIKVVKKDLRHQFYYQVDIESILLFSKLK